MGIWLRLKDINLELNDVILRLMMLHLGLWVQGTVLLSERCSLGILITPTFLLFKKTV
jgi:hypothetical protein